MAFASLLANRRYRHPPFYTVCGGGLCNFGIADLDCLGQTRRFDRPLLTSGLTPETDIQLIRGHVSNVPLPDSCAAAKAHPNLRQILHQSWTHNIIDEIS